MGVLEGLLSGILGDVSEGMQHKSPVGSLPISPNQQ